MAATFDTTSWSVVLSARDADSVRARVALDALCSVYWQPIYVHVRRRGYAAEDAQDLTQEFFTQLLARRFLEDVNRDRGRFRTFLLASLNHFLANEWKRAHSQRRGGSALTLSMNFQDAEERLHLHSGGDGDPRRQYDRQWARALLDTVIARLEREYAATGRAGLFGELRPCLSARRETIAYRELGARLGVSEGAVKGAVHRMRRRYALLLQREVARTVESAADVDAELRYLIEMMGAPAGSEA